MDYINLYQRQELGETYRTGVTVAIFQPDRRLELEMELANSIQNSNGNK